MGKLKQALSGVLLFVVVATVPSDAQASTAFIPDSDSATFVAMLAALAAINENIQSSVQVTRDALGYARSGLQAAAMVRSAVEDPEDFFRREAALFERQYNLDGIRHEVNALKQDLREFGNVDGAYDPYKFRAVIRNVADGASEGKFNVVTRILDVWRLNDPHDAYLEQLKAVKAEAAQLRADVEVGAGAGMTQKEASVFTAKATSQMNSSLADLLRIEQERYYAEQVSLMSQADAATAEAIKKREETSFTLFDYDELRPETDIEIER